MNACIPESNVQVRLWLSPVSAAKPEAGATLNIASSCASVGPSPVIEPEAVTVVTNELTVSAKSASFTVSVPQIDRPAFVSVRVAAVLSVVTTWMSGASLVPVTVMVTTWATLPPLPSSIVTVNFSVAVWPAAR